MALPGPIFLESFRLLALDYWLHAEGILQRVG